jgi:hypothetical protein
MADKLHKFPCITILHIEEQHQALTDTLKHGNVYIFCELFNNAFSTEST